MDKKEKIKARKRELYALNPEKSKARAKKWNKENPKRRKETARIWRENNPNYKKEFKEKYPEKFEAQRFKSMMWRIKVDMTYDEFKQMFKKQKGVCKICGGLETKRRLSVDHCHETGKVRGLLCQQCNIALGLFKDNPKLLKKAIKYLIKK